MKKERKSDDEDNDVVDDNNTSLELLQPPRVRWRATEPTSTREDQKKS
jgi:hypothetical protein